MHYDEGCEGSSAHPGWKGGSKGGGGSDAAANDGGEEAHPMDVFGATAVHGGSWRCAYSVDSIGKASYVLGAFFG